MKPEKRYLEEAALGSQNDSDEDDTNKMIQGAPSTDPPEGAWSWLVAFGCWTAQLTAIAPIPVFGIMYSEIFMQEGASATTTSLVYSLQVFFWGFSEIFAATLCDLFGWRKVGFCGTFMMGFALIMSAFAKKPWHLLLLYSTFHGMGIGVVIPICNFVLANHFKKRRGFVMGMLMVFPSSNFLTCPILITYLRRSFGPKGALMIFGALICHGCVGSMLFVPIESRRNPRKNLAENAVNLNKTVETTDKSEFQEESSLLYEYADKSAANSKNSEKVVLQKDKIPPTETENSIFKQEENSFNIRKRPCIENINSNRADPQHLLYSEDNTKSHNFTEEKDEQDYRNTEQVDHTARPDSTSNEDTNKEEFLDDSSSSTLIKLRGPKNMYARPESLSDLVEEQHSLGNNSPFASAVAYQQNTADQIQSSDIPAKMPSDINREEKKYTLDNKMIEKETLEFNEAREDSSPAGLTPETENFAARSPDRSTEINESKKELLLLTFLKSVWKSLLLIKSHRVKILTSAFSLFLIAFMNTNALISFIIREKGYSLDDSAWVISITAIFSITTRILVTLFIDFVKSEKRFIFMTGAFFTAIGLFVLALVTQWTPILCSMVFYAVGTGCCMVSCIILMVEFMGTDFFPQTFTVCSVGLSLVLGLVSPLLGLMKDQTGSFTLTLMFMSASSLLAFFLYFLMPMAVRSDQRRNCAQSKNVS